MQKNYSLVKKALNRGFSLFRNRFPSRVTSRKDKILVKGFFCDSVLKNNLYIIFLIFFGTFWGLVRLLNLEKLKPKIFKIPWFLMFDINFFVLGSFSTQFSSRNIILILKSKRLLIHGTFPKFFGTLWIVWNWSVFWLFWRFDSLFIIFFPLDFNFDLKNLKY